MRICLFDWTDAGHTAGWLRSCAVALEEGHDVVIAASDPVLAKIDGIGAKRYSLGEARPLIDPKVPGRGKSDIAATELGLLRTACDEVHPDRLVHLYADPILRWWATEDTFPTATCAMIHFPPAQFNKAYGVESSKAERLHGWFKGFQIARWRHRPDAHSLFGHDPVAAKRWARGRGAPAFLIPEAPLELQPVPRPPEQRSGALMFGHLDQRKGFNLLAEAMELGGEGLQIDLLGRADPDFLPELRSHVERMRSAGAEVSLDAEGASYGEAMIRMASASCALLSFGWKPSASRVLLEAAAAQTPVIGSANSAIGHLIESRGLGITVGPADPAALRDAIRRLTLEPDAAAPYRENLSGFARQTQETFSPAFHAALDLPSP